MKKLKMIHYMIIILKLNKDIFKADIKIIDKSLKRKIV
jgi:hypothetical protein